MKNKTIAQQMPDYDWRYDPDRGAYFLLLSTAYRSAALEYVVSADPDVPSGDVQQDLSRLLEIIASCDPSADAPVRMRAGYVRMR